jgi:hypothetical protein
MTESTLVSDDELVLHLIATGVVKLVEKVKDGKPLNLPYITPLQLGLNKLSAICLLKGETPPQGVPDLLRWCEQRPLVDWPLELTNYGFSQEDKLLYEQIPTTLCYEELACSNSDVEAELTQNKIIIRALNICKDANAPESYVKFRRFLIENLVITDREFVECCLTLSPEALTEPLKEAYDPAPDSAIIDDYFHCCSICGNLLLRHIKKGLICPIDPSHNSINITRRLHKQEKVSWLKRGLRQFIAAPGVAELRLEKQLKELGKGISVELWPEFDKYDLRIVFPDGEAWAIDVKDWKTPYCLAKKVNSQPVPYYPEWKKFYFVFPDARSNQNPNYLKAFSQHCSILKKNTIDADLESGLIKKVKQKLRQVK